MECYVVIGSSRGLGAALVDDLIMKDAVTVIGVARTPITEIATGEQWVRSGKYHHIEMDITLPESESKLQESVAVFSSSPLCIIFNAAIIESDINDERETINFKIFDDINTVGITGFRNCIKAFESSLLKNGGTFIGISSFSAYAPPVLGLKFAYPATKAYLDMALTFLRFLWSKKVRVVTVHLGCIGGGDESFLSKLLKPSYKKTANHLIKKITDNSNTTEINYPFLYTVCYKYLLKFIPETIYFSLLSRLAGLKNIKKIVAE